ncbi:hypothetical protein [Rodentibacter mrazii]|uniref:hypothetical protein n=1 Tax=Rodentibacter mrazii TaxID=1908257 RepID=UPI001FCA26F2|nr:hypothetical protein [Rodentibacter mrazii]
MKKLLTNSLTHLFTPLGAVSKATVQKTLFFMTALLGLTMAITANATPMMNIFELGVKKGAEV